MKHIALLIIFSNLFVISALSQANAPKYSNEFLNIGVGGRAMAMGNSVVATVDDVTAGYWNPAGLVDMDGDWQVGLMHSEYFAGIAKYDFLSGAYKIDDNSALGVSIIRFGVDNIPNTTELIDNNGNIDYDRITYFSSSDYAFIASYARNNLPLGLTGGVNFKVVHRRIGDFAQAWGIGIDAGLKYNHNKWNMGLMFRDVTTTVNAWSYNISEDLKQVFDSTGNDIPQNSTEITIPKMILGVGRTFVIKDKFHIKPELNMNVTFDGRRNALFSFIDPTVGVEGAYKKNIFLRLGLFNIQRIKDISGEQKINFQPTLGVGVRIKSFFLDYALTNIGNNQLGVYSNVFSLRFQFLEKE